MSRSGLQARIAAARLYGILDTSYSDPARWPDLATQLIEGGVGLIQLRAKNSDPALLLDTIPKVLAVTRPNAIPLIINDHPDIAAATGADGCHVGQEDMPVEEVRRIIGPDRVVGKSTHSLAQARAGEAEGADYIGFGPIFATQTKPDYIPIGPEVIRQMSREIKIPAFCIGGIKLENLPGLLACGARRVVIVSGLLQALDPAAYARKVLQQL